MKTIKIPALVTIATGGQSKEVSFAEFLSLALEQYAPFAQGAKGARQYAKIMDVIEKATDEMAFEDDDFGKVREAVDGVKWLSPAVNRAFLGFYQLLDDSMR